MEELDEDSVLNRGTGTGTGSGARMTEKVGSWFNQWHYQSLDVFVKENVFWVVVAFVFRYLIRPLLKTELLFVANRVH